MNDIHNDTATLTISIWDRLNSLLFKTLSSVPAILIFAVSLTYAALLTPYIYNRLGGNYDVRQLNSNFFFVAFNDLILFAIPALYCKFILRASLADFGLRFPTNKIRALLPILGALAFLIPFMWYFSKEANFKSYYTIPDVSSARIIFLNLTVFPCYYVGEEFFFRGFLFLALWRKVRWHSFWITDVIFTLAHITKPGLEILLSIPASIIFNFLTLTTRSIIPAWTVHFMMGTLLFIFVNMKILG